MPIPMLLAGLGVVAGVVGAGGHLSAKETNERAQRVSENAQEIYDNAKRSLEVAQEKTEKALVKLGYAKKNILDSSMNQFLTAYDKVKHVQVKESVGIMEISKFAIDQQGAVQLREMTNIYSSSFASGVTGAAAGVAIALAASGALPVVTGELALVGSALAAGEIGMAAGFAGSALSFGAAMTPLAAVAAPVILFTGISASMKADENLEKANAMYAEAEAASEKMKISETLCDAISARSEMFGDLLGNLNKMFAPCSELLTGVVRKKESGILKKKLTSEDFTEEEVKLIAVTRALAGAVKSVIDTPMLSKEGNISREAEETYNKIVEKIPLFSQGVQEVNQVNYGVKPVAARAVTALSGGKASGGMTVMDGARSAFAVVLGIILASVFAENLAQRVTDEVNQFLFLDSDVANRAALWFLLCSSVTMLVGKFRGTKVEKLCGWSSGISLFVLYVQYCRTVEQMDHYIIFSVLFFIALVSAYVFLDGKKDKWQFGLFISLELLVMALWPLGFLVYSFFSKLVRLPDVFCLVVTSALMCFVSVFGMVGMLDGTGSKG